MIAISHTPKALLRVESSLAALSGMVLVSGVLEAAVRVVTAKVFFGLWGTQVLFWSEPMSWMAAWIFVLVPYIFYQRIKLRH